MLTVTPVQQATIDAWPLDKAGLPVRVVNATTSAGCSTVADLRACTDAYLLSLRSLGKISLAHIHRFFGLCDHIEAGTQTFGSMDEILATFLDPSELSVLAARYGLYQDELVATRQWVTLQDIGKVQNKTRERVRQIEEAALLNLQSELATLCLQPFQVTFRKFIEKEGQAISPESLGPLSHHPLLAGLNPVGLILLLYDVNSFYFGFNQGVFTSVTDEVVDRARQAAEQIILSSPRPVSLPDLIVKLNPLSTSLSLSQPETFYRTILDHDARVLSTQDHHYLHAGEALSFYLAELLNQVEKPAHFRTVTSLYNAKVKKSSQKGAGFILDALTRSPGCRRVERGLYDTA